MFSGVQHVDDDDADEAGSGCACGVSSGVVADATVADVEGGGNGCTH